MSNPIHRAERTFEHEMYISIMLEDPDFNPNTMIPGLFYELPFTAQELAQLADAVTDKKGGLTIANHPNANMLVKAKLITFLIEDVIETEEETE